MRPALFLSAVFLCTGSAASAETLAITFKDGRVLTFNTKDIAKIDFETPSRTGGKAPCWDGAFTGSDISGYPMKLELREHDGTVEGGYSYFHKARGVAVTAVISETVVDGDVLRGRWKQVTGIPAEGRFEWRWLSGDRCRSLEGNFDGTKYWPRMTRASP